MLGLHHEKVCLCPYDPTWKDEYEKEKKFLLEHFKDYAVDIQHVGSTSIPGLHAKPIVDIAFAVKDIETLHTLLPKFESMGYDVKDSIDTHGEFVVRVGTPECVTHYVHVEVIDGEYWHNHIDFRDYLISHPEYIKKYEDFKSEVLENFKDRKSYTANKKSFIDMVLNLARSEKENEKTAM